MRVWVCGWVLTDMVIYMEASIPVLFTSYAESQNNITGETATESDRQRSIELTTTPLCVTGTAMRAGVCMCVKQRSVLAAVTSFLEELLLCRGFWRSFQPT